MTVTGVIMDFAVAPETNSWLSAAASAVADKESLIPENCLEACISGNALYIDRNLEKEWAEYAEDLSVIWTTALMLAVKHNREDIVDLLLQCGADAMIEDKEGMSAYMIAQNRKDKKMMQKLSGN